MLENALHLLEDSALPEDFGQPKERRNIVGRIGERFPKCGLRSFEITFREHDVREVVAPVILLRVEQYCVAVTRRGRDQKVVGVIEEAEIAVHICKLLFGFTS